MIYETACATTSQLRSTAKARVIVLRTELHQSQERSHGFREKGFRLTSLNWRFACHRATVVGTTMMRIAIAGVVVFGRSVIAG